MKVLFCTDGSECSLYAIKKALPFLRADYELTIINVIDWGFFPTYVTFPHETEEGFPDQKNASQKILENARQAIEKMGYKVAKSEFLYGRTYEMLIELINSGNYDLAILGSHGKKGIRKWLGSISSKIITKSNIPIFIAKPRKNGDEQTEAKKALIAADGSDCSYRAIQKALSLLDFGKISTEILTVREGVETLPVEIIMDNEWLSKALSKQKEIADEIIDKSSKILLEKGIKPENSLSLGGDASEVILKYLQDSKKDLVIMGTHGREGVSDWLLGSVSKRVLDNADTPVLIIPTKGFWS